MSELKPCPCGKTPDELGICHNGQGYKWAEAMCNQCGCWRVEFRTQYHALDSVEVMELAIQAWNEAPRGGPESQKDIEAEREKEHA